MRLTDVYTARAIASRFTEDASNSIQYFGQIFFPVRKKMGIDLKWIKGHKGTGIALKPSAFDALATIRPRQGFEVTKEEMPLFRESMMVTEQDIVEIMRAQEATDPYLAEVLDHMYDDAEQLVAGAEVSLERMRMQLLAPVNGNMVISIGMADNTAYNYNYDAQGTWKASNYAALSGNATWVAANKATATPLNDIQVGVDKLVAKGYSPKYAMMNSVTLNALMGLDQMRNAFITTTGVTMAYMDKQTAKELFERLTGLAVIINDKHFTDYDGSDKKFFPDNYVSIISDQQLGNTWLGTTPEERTLLGDAKVEVSVVNQGVAVCVQTQYGPPVQHSTTVSAVALPSFEGMDGLYVIKTA